MKTAVLFAVVASLPTMALAQKPASSGEPVAQVGLFGYRADGTVAGSAYDTAPELSSIVYLNAARCVYGAGNRQAPPDATDVWQFAGKVLSATPEEAVVHLEWRRLVAPGQPVSGNESTVQLTLRRDEPVQLDHATAHAGCSTVSMAFEARYEARFASLRAGAVGREPAVGGQSSASASGGGVRMGVHSGSGSGHGGGSGGSVSVASAAGPATASGLFEVNLWLVRSAPGRPDEVTHSLLRMNQDGASFAFSPIAVTTTRGDAIVQVTGSLAVIRGTDGEERLVFSTARRVMQTSAGETPRDAETQGSSRIVNRMPGPEEVLSFEMPPIAVNGQQAAPDKLSVRLKITPRR